MWKQRTSISQYLNLLPPPSVPYETPDQWASPWGVARLPHPPTIPGWSSSSLFYSSRSRRKGRHNSGRPTVVFIPFPDRKVSHQKGSLVNFNADWILLVLTGFGLSVFGVEVIDILLNLKYSRKEVCIPFQDRKVLHQKGYLGNLTLIGFFFTVDLDSVYELKLSTFCWTWRIVGLMGISE